MGFRRMFSSRITSSTSFLKMPLSTQALYFHLGLHADDDGIVEAFTVMRQINANDDELKVLASKEFIKVLNEDYVSYITDWHEHNLLRADRKIDSIYKELLIKMLPDVKILEAKKRADTKTYTGRPVDSISKVKLSKVKQIVDASFKIESESQSQTDNQSECDNTKNRQETPIPTSPLTGSTILPESARISDPEASEGHSNNYVNSENDVQIKYKERLRFFFEKWFEYRSVTFIPTKYHYKIIQTLNKHNPTEKLIEEAIKAKSNPEWACDYIIDKSNIEKPKRGVDTQASRRYKRPQTAEEQRNYLDELAKKVAQ